MKISFGFRTEDTKKVREWVKRTDKNLRIKKGIFFSGAARSLGKGLYIVSMETVIGFDAFLIGPLFLMFGGMFSYFVWGFGTWVVYVGAVMTGVTYLLVTPALHRVVIRLALRKLMGRRVKVLRATEDVLWGLSHGAK